MHANRWRFHRLSDRLRRRRFFDWFGRQAQTRENHCETKAGRLAERSLQQDEKARAEKKKRQCVSRSDLADGKATDSKNERTTPNQKCEPEDRSALEQNPRPLILR